MLALFEAPIPAVKSKNIPLKLLYSDVNVALGPIAYHARVIEKIVAKVAGLSVSSNLGLTFEMMKITANITR